MKLIKVIYVSECGPGKTTYLYDKSTKTLLPIDISVSNRQTWIPEMLNSLFLILKGNPVGIEICGFSENKYYTKLIIQNNYGCYCKLKLPIEHSLDLSVQNNLPILIKDYLLARQGIKVTKDLIEKSLTVTADSSEY